MEPLPPLPQTVASAQTIASPLRQAMTALSEHKKNPLYDNIH